MPDDVQIQEFPFRNTSYARFCLSLSTSEV